MLGTLQRPDHHFAPFDGAGIVSAELKPDRPTRKLTAIEGSGPDAIHLEGQVRALSQFFVMVDG